MMMLKFTIQHKGVDFCDPTPFLDVALPVHGKTLRAILSPMKTDFTLTKNIFFKRLCNWETYERDLNFLSIQFPEFIFRIGKTAISSEIGNLDCVQFFHDGEITIFTRDDWVPPQFMPSEM